MTKLKVEARGRTDFIETDDFNGKPYGEFTKFVQKNYDKLYGTGSEGKLHKVNVKVYGTKRCTYSGKLTIYVSKESEIYDEIGRQSDNIEWDSWPDDEDDIELDDDYEISSIDDGKGDLDPEEEKDEKNKKIS